MNIEEPQRCLGGVDVQALSEAILGQEPQAWTEQLSRQQKYEVHRDTQSIVLLFCDESWPNGEIYQESGWDRLSEVAMPLIDQIINTHYASGGTLLRAMAAKPRVVEGACRFLSGQNWQRCPLAQWERRERNNGKKVPDGESSRL